MNQARTVLTAAIGLLPATKFKNFLFRCVGHEVSQGAVVGPGLFIRVGRLRLLERTRVGPFNVFRDLRLLELGDGSTIGQWNWVSAAPSISVSRDGGSLRVGRESAITSRHYFDCSGGVAIGNFTTFAGVRSTVISHGIDWRVNQQKARGVKIGSFAIVGSNCSITPGSIIPDRCVVGMGSTVSGHSLPAESLAISPRAEAIRSDVAGKYFSRVRGYVD